jgi:hypothetical protein
MYKFALLDPRPIPAAQAANDLVFADVPCGICAHSSGQLDGETCRHCGGTGSVPSAVLGIEVTVPALAARCSLGNIDPQHSGGDATRAAIEVVLEMADAGLPKGSTLATVRADLDSVGAMAVLSLLYMGHDTSCIFERMMMVADADKFARGSWLGPRPLPSQDNPWPSGSAGASELRDLAAINAAVADFKVPIADRVAAMEAWLLTGDEPDLVDVTCSGGDADSPIGLVSKYRLQVERERDDLIAAIERGDIQTSLASEDKVAIVETTHRAATMIGYSFAPVVVALNPAFRMAGGEPHRKFTVCQFTGDYVNLKAAVAELSELEPGWGGSPTIIGSPQGQGSILTTEQVVQVITKHLK